MNAITVPFHGAELFVIEYNGQPYTPMKPIVDGMGMDWGTQFRKLKQRFESTIVEMTMVANDGKERLMTCLPVRKLFGWLMTISPNKVRPELRDTIIMYQNECDDVLWDYWTNGRTSIEVDPITKLEQLLNKVGSRYPALKHPIAHEIAERIGNSLAYNDITGRLVYWVHIDNGEVGVQQLPSNYAPVNIVRLADSFTALHEFMVGAEVVRQANHLRKIPERSIPMHTL